MLDFTRTRIVESIEKPVQTGYTVTAEGQALVADYTSGVFGLKAATGASTDQFYGVSMAQQMTLLYVPYMESVVIGASDTTFTTAFTPASGSLFIYDVTSSTALAAGDPATTANEYSISGNTVTIHTGQQGHTLRVQYRYSPTTVQARTLQGDIPPGGAANLTLGTVGIVMKGQIATTEYNTAVDWNVSAPVLKLAANGLFTLGGSGATVPGAVIVSLPTVGDPVLVFEI